jgi:hypothetical protein
MRSDSRSTAPNRAQAAGNYGKIALSFEANAGQADARVKYLSRGRGYALFLTNDEAVLSLRSQNPEAGKQNGEERASSPVAGQAQAPNTQSGAVLRMKLKGANPRARVTVLDELPGKTNYFIGNDPKKWRTNVPTYAKVKYQNVYSGVDLVFYGDQQQLEYDFIVSPGTDPGFITFGLKGAEKLSVDGEGNLVVEVAGGAAQFQKPVIYQEIRGVRQEIAGGYVLDAAHQVGFQVGTYDHSKPLVIDPVLAYSTYLGGSREDTGSFIAVDASGNAYVIGATTGAFPVTAGAFQTTFGGGIYNVFVAKLNSTGTALVYSTYLGGSGYDVGGGIAVDLSGNAYVTGQTSSSNFPTTAGAFQTTFSASSSAFVAKLSSAGSSLLYSTYLGGSSFSIAGGNGIAIDSSGNAYVTGRTTGSFPTTAGAVQTTFGGGFNDDAFVAELNPTGTALIYSTYLGGSGSDVGNGIAVDSSGNAYVAGQTSGGFPTTAGAFQTTFGGGSYDVFVAKLNSAGSALLYSSYLGGSGIDYGTGVALDSLGNAYVTGRTTGSFPTTAGAFQPAFGGGTGDAFIFKLDTNLSGAASLVYSTYVGGSGDDTGQGIAVDSSGDAYVTGQTSSTNFPVTALALQSNFGGGSSDAFVTELNSSGQLLVYSSYLGGSGYDFGFGLAVDSLGHYAYITGQTSGNFPTTPGAFQTAYGGGSLDAFVAKISTTFDDDSGLASLSGTNSFTGNQTINGVVTATSFFGNGSGLTGINPANISAGTAGINITGNAAKVTNGLYSTGSYANPPWITSLAGTKITGTVPSAAIATNATELGGVLASKYARLDIANLLHGNQSVTGNLTVSGPVSFASTLAIGGGTPIKQYVSATYLITVPSLGPSSCTTLTETLNAVGSGTNDTVALGVPNSFMSAGGFLIFQAWESAANTIKIRVCNVAPILPASSAVKDTIRVDILKH